MPIVLLRVDERLIHGQVVVGWGQALGLQRVVVVDDELAAAPWEQELYRLGVPPEWEVIFVSVDEAAPRWPAWADEPARTAVLLRDVTTLARLADRVDLRGTTVNLGGLHARPDRQRVLPYLFLGEDERTQLRRLAERGIAIEARDVPAAPAVPLTELAPV